MNRPGATGRTTSRGTWTERSTLLTSGEEAEGRRPARHLPRRRTSGPDGLETGTYVPERGEHG